MEILNEPQRGTLAWNAGMERQRENWSCVHNIRLVDVTDHGGTQKKLFFSITTFHATRYRSVVTSAYIASWKFEVRRDVLESLVGMDWVGSISPPFSLAGASYHTSQ